MWYGGLRFAKQAWSFHKLMEDSEVLQTNVVKLCGLPDWEGAS